MKKIDVLNTENLDLFNISSGADGSGEYAEGTAPTVTAPLPYDKANDSYGNMTCQDLSNKFGIEAGVSWGTANISAINSWKNRKCNTNPKTSSENLPENGEEAFKEDGNDDNSGSDKILGMPKNIIIGLGVALVLIGGFLIYKKVGKK